jgi:hypothetical protein
MSTKDHPGWDEAKWGKEDFREFDKCQVCGTEHRYVVECMRGYIPADKIELTPPVLGRLEFTYDIGIFRHTITAVVDICCECGALWTVARSHKKVLLSSLMISPGGHG